MRAVRVARDGGSALRRSPLPWFAGVREDSMLAGARRAAIHGWISPTRRNPLQSTIVRHSWPSTSSTRTSPRAASSIAARTLSFSVGSSGDTCALMVCGRTGRKEAVAGHVADSGWNDWHRCTAKRRLLLLPRVRPRYRRGESPRRLEGGRPYGGRTAWTADTGRGVRGCDRRTIVTRAPGTIA